MWATYAWMEGTLSLQAACWVEACTATTSLSCFACTMGCTVLGPSSYTEVPWWMPLPRARPPPPVTNPSVCAPPPSCALLPSMPAAAASTVARCCNERGEMSPQEHCFKDE